MQESSSTGRPETEHRKRIEVIWLGFHTTAWSWVGVARVTLLHGCRFLFRKNRCSLLRSDSRAVVIGELSSLGCSMGEGTA